MKKIVAFLPEKQITKSLLARHWTMKKKSLSIWFRDPSPLTRTAHLQSAEGSETQLKVQCYHIRHLLCDS